MIKWCQVLLWEMRYLQWQYRTINTKHHIEWKGIRLLSRRFWETQSQLQLNWIFNDATVIIEHVTPVTEHRRQQGLNASLQITTQYTSPSKNDEHMGLIVEISLDKTEQLLSESESKSNHKPGVDDVSHLLRCETKRQPWLTGELWCSSYKQHTHCKDIQFTLLKKPHCNHVHTILSTFHFKYNSQQPKPINLNDGKTYITFLPTFTARTLYRIKQHTWSFCDH